MPKRIDAFALNKKYRTLKYVADDVEEEWMALAYPGKFVGVGEDAQAAMHMAKMRYRAEKKKFLEADESRTEKEWEEHASKRQVKIEEAHGKFGISKKSVWSEDDMQKKKEK